MHALIHPLAGSHFPIRDAKALLMLCPPSASPSLSPFPPAAAALP